MDEWFNQIESNVYSQLEYMLKGKADAPFPNLYMTTVSQEVKEPDLPAMRVHELNPVETGQDLDNVTVNAVMSTFEIQAWSNQGESHCKAILTKAVTEMKRMRFNIIMLPTTTTSNGLAWGVFRARRVIGAGDTL